MTKILLAYCDFQNQFMEAPCNKKMLNDHGEPFCLDHGTRRYVVRASDIKGVSENIDTHRNTGSRWTAEEVKLLFEMEEEGMSIDDIASELNRTVKAVYYKIWSKRNG